MTTDKIRTAAQALLDALDNYTLHPGTVGGNRRKQQLRSAADETRAALADPERRSPLPLYDPVTPDTQRGLYAKFNVSRTDGSSAPGGKHDGCDYFVLDVTHDKHAPAALAAYAASVAATYPQLASDMRARWGLAEPAQPAPAADAVPVLTHEQVNESMFSSNPRTAFLVYQRDHLAAMEAMRQEVERLKANRSAQVAEVMRLSESMASELLAWHGRGGSEFAYDTAYNETEAAVRKLVEGV